MSIKCTALIKKRPKRGKASIYAWPKCNPTGKEWIDTPHVEDEGVEVCGGEVRVLLEIITEGGCDCCGYSSIELNEVCTLCKTPFYDKKPELMALISSGDSVDITTLIE